MKKLVLILVLVAVNLVSFAQSDSVIVKRVVHEMTDEVYWSTNFRLVAANQELTRGFTVQPIIDKGTYIIDLIVKPVGLGNCNENNVLIIKFVDGIKVKLKSWSDFDCTVAYFTPTNYLVSKLKVVEVDKMYFQNGHTLDSGTFPVDNPKYFIQLYKGLKNK